MYSWSPWLIYVTFDFGHVHDFRLCITAVKISILCNFSIWAVAAVGHIRKLCCGRVGVHWGIARDSSSLQCVHCARLYTWLSIKQQVTHVRILPLSLRILFLTAISLRWRWIMMTVVTESDYMWCTRLRYYNMWSVLLVLRTCHFLTDNSLQSADKDQQESRAVAQNAHDAVVEFNTYQNLQRHRAVLAAVAWHLVYKFVIQVSWAIESLIIIRDVCSTQSGPYYDGFPLVVHSYKWVDNMTDHKRNINTSTVTLILDKNTAEMYMYTKITHKYFIWLMRTLCLKMYSSRHPWGTNSNTTP